jgi:hypothetical protein
MLNNTVSKKKLLLFIIPAKPVLSKVEGAGIQINCRVGPLPHHELDSSFSYRNPMGGSLKQVPREACGERGRTVEGRSLGMASSDESE